MPRYVIGNVEIPVNPATSVNALVDKEALKKQKEVVAKPAPSAPSSSSSSWVIPGLVGLGVVWVAWGDKIKAKLAKKG